MPGVELINTTLFNDPNLIAYWRFEQNGNDSKDGHSTTSVTGNYNPAGQFGYAYQQSSVTQSFNTDITGWPQGESPKTVMAWANPSTSTNNTYVIGIGDPNVFGIGQQTSNWILNNDLGGIVAGGTPSIGDWTFLAGTYKSSVATFYMNGSVIGSVGGTLNSSPGFATIGNYPNQTGSTYIGRIDDIAVFSRCLTSVEISNHYNGTDAISSTLSSLSLLKAG